MSSSPLLGPLQTQLPPSPELKSALNSSRPQPFSLDGGPDFAQTPTRRLRSVARYQSFYPQILACSHTLSTYDDRGGMVSKGGSSTSLSCLGAVAGSQGVALFKLSKPHAPLLVLSHATNTASMNSISSLAFEPKQSETDSLYLAATRGSGVLVWDASGHSPNPLVGRVSTDLATSGGLDDSRLTSMAWKPSSPSPTLATAAVSTLCVWDLRTPSKPTTKFGPVRKPFTSPLVQVACSPNEEMAAIDVAGIVRIYDIRMNTARNQSAVSSFAAHETAGVGIASFGTSRWLSWGLDAPMASAVIKIWTKREATTFIPTEELPPKSAVSEVDYSLAAQCVRPNLACARICLSPADNKFMAIGHLSSLEPHGDTSGKVEGWWAELYKLQDQAENTLDLDERLSIRTFGIEKEAAFHGGEATSHADKAVLVSALGSRTKLGGLQAAEVSLASVGESSNDVEMILCCLSDSGVLSIHSISEALPKSASHEGVSPEPLGKRFTVHEKMARNVFSLSSSQARIYPEDREGASLADAAGFWGTSRTVESTNQNRFAERRLSLDPVSASPQKNVEVLDQSNQLDRRPEGGLMPFDMDVPVAYGSVTTGAVANLQIGVNDMSTGAILSGTGMVGIVDEGGPGSGDPSKKSSTVESIETERVPCPRLCGAVFGRGNGGLVTFHNGEVRKMWSWYQRTDNARIPQLLPDAITAGQESMGQAHYANASGSTYPLTTQDESSTKTAPLSKQGPRTLKELINMVAAAKDAQWGEDAVSDGSESDDVQSGRGDFFEDDSLGSNSSDDDFDEDGLGGAQTEDVYKRYFGSQDSLKGGIPKAIQSPSQSQPPPSPASPFRRTKQAHPFAGPSSDMLDPVVRLTRRYDNEMLANQSRALAEGWELGPWDTSLVADVDNVPFSFGGEETKSEVMSTDVDLLYQEGSTPLPYLLNSPPTFGFGETPSMVRTKSDGNLGKVVQPMHTVSSNATLSARTGESLRRIMKESGLRGSEVGVRPNMEEPMKFFKKLFNQPQEGGPAGFSTMLSPPDRPYDHFFANSTLSPGRDATQGNLKSLYGHSRQSAGDRSDAHGTVAKLGTYTLTIRPANSALDKRRRGNLKEIKDRCLRNASVCAKTGNEEKEGVWKLLAQTVERQIEELDGKQAFSGWGGNGGGALGVQLVGTLLNYYEALGDCQMLATMACVLSGGRRSLLRRQIRMVSDEYRPYLLPLDQDETYDTYIRKYADLLYEWGLLTRRAELNKHLVRVPTELIYSDALPSATSEKQITEAGEMVSFEGRQPGVAVVFQCSRCGDHTDFNSNVCGKCRDFSFRCSICDNAVKGLFTVCDICNHGGHVNHMTLWFSKHVECPTGCGCTCAMSPYLSSGTSEGT